MSGQRSLTAAKAQAESNQTSRMSVSLRSAVPPHDSHFSPGGAKRSSGAEYQTPVPSFSTASATRSMSSGLTTDSPHPSQRSTGMGTPQVRWRLMHQSGRFSTIPRMRERPHSGTQVTVWSISLSAFPRRVASRPPVVSSGRSMAMNHWGVARKMMGLWHRQQCG